MSKVEGFLVFLGFVLAVVVYGTLTVVTLKTLPSDWLQVIAILVFVVVVLAVVCVSAKDVEKMKKEQGEKP